MTQDEMRHLRALAQAASIATDDLERVRRSMEHVRELLVVAEQTHEAKMDELDREVARLAGKGAQPTAPAGPDLGKALAPHLRCLVAVREEGTDGGIYRFATEAMQAEALAAVGHPPVPYPAEWGSYGWDDLCGRLVEAGKAVLTKEEWLEKEERK